MAIRVVDCVLMLIHYKVEEIDEGSASAKMSTYTLHQNTMDYVIENCDSTVAKYKAMLQQE